MTWKSPVSPAEADDYERRLVEAVRAALPRESDHPIEGRRGQHVVFDDVAIEGVFPDSVLVVYVRDPARPECHFAASWQLWTHHRHPDGHIEPPFSPAERAGAGRAKEAEEFLTVGLPADCAEGDVTWVPTRSRVLDPSYYGARLLAAFREQAHRGVTDANFGDRGSSPCRVRQVYLDGEYPHQGLAVLIDAERRPECTFGFRLRLWDEGGRPVGEEDWPTPEDHAWILAINLDENLSAKGYGLPEDCASEGITWVT